MSKDKPKPTIVVVAFRHDQEKSVLYRKCIDSETMRRALVQAQQKGATFASVRFLLEINKYEPS